MLENGWIREREIWEEERLTNCYCGYCGERTHYDDLDEDGLCPECRAEAEEEGDDEED